MRRKTRQKTTGLETTDQQERFCQAYALSLKVTDGEKAAGYCTGYGHQLMRKTWIRERIAAIQAGAAARTVADQNAVIREACYLGYSDITEVMSCASLDELKELPERVRRAIKSITRDDFHGPDGAVIRTRYRFTMHEKIEVLKLLALITKAIDPGSREAKDSPPFSGFTIITRQLPAPAGGNKT
jgi:hypothetical protein